jgi:hypothetical protein
MSTELVLTGAGKRKAAQEQSLPQQTYASSIQEQRRSLDLPTPANITAASFSMSTLYPQLSPERSASSTSESYALTR